MPRGAAAAALVPELRGHLGAIERADSITFDAHKWMSVPMGAGIFLTRHRDAPERTFSIGTDYMPVLGTERRRASPHDDAVVAPVHRPEGLPVAGGRRLGGLRRRDPPPDADGRSSCESASPSDGWQVINRTPLPTVCWNDARSADNSVERLAALCRHVVESGEAWISTTKIAGRLPVLRATITNYRTEESDVDRLVDCLGRARRSVAG